MNDQAQIMAENLLQLQKLSNLTRRQLLIWLGQQGHLSTPKYSIPFLWTFEQDLDPGILQAAFQQVVDDHETLRTVIQLESGIPKARIMSEMKVLMDVVDLSSHTDPEPALREWIQQRIGRGFQLEHCLFDTALVKLQNHCAWYLNEHHLITDGRSKQLVFQNTADEFAQLSGEAVAGQGDPVQFSEYIEFERKSLEKRSANRARQYWSDFLTSNPACEVFPTPSDHLTPGVRISRELDASYTRRIRANGSALEGNLTFVSTLVTALLTLLYRRTGSPKLTIAHTLSNRPQPRHQEMLGLCLEVAPLAVNIEPGETFHTLRLKVMKRILEGMRHMQHIPWNHSDQPVYDVMFNYLNPHFGKFHGMDVEAEWLYPGHQETSLTLQVQEFREDDILRIAFDFRCDAVPAAEREPLISQFFEILDNLLKDSGRNLIL